MRISDWSSDVCSSDLMRCTKIMGASPSAGLAIACHCTGIELLLYSSITATAHASGVDASVATVNSVSLIENPGIHDSPVTSGGMPVLPPEHVPQASILAIPEQYPWQYTSSSKQQM